MERYILEHTGRLTEDERLFIERLRKLPEEERQMLIEKINKTELDYNK